MKNASATKNMVKLPKTVGDCIPKRSLKTRKFYLNGNLVARQRIAFRGHDEQFHPAF